MPNHIGFLDGVFDHKGDCRAPDYGPCSCGMTELLRKARAFDWLAKNHIFNSAFLRVELQPATSLLEAIETARAEGGGDE